MRSRWPSLALIALCAAIMALEWARLASAEVPSTVRELKVLEARSRDLGSLSVRQREVQAELLMLVRSIAEFVDAPLRESRAAISRDVALEVARLGEPSVGTEPLQDFMFLQLGTQSLDLGRIDSLEFELRGLCELAASVLIKPNGDLSSDVNGRTSLGERGWVVYRMLEQLEGSARPRVGWPSFREGLAQHLRSLANFDGESESGGGAQTADVVSLSEEELCRLGRKVSKSKAAVNE